MSPGTLSLDDVGRILAARPPEISSAERDFRASVALMLREGGRGLEMLFIERAVCDGDPWSGNLGFPGGKVEEHDPDMRATAERETLEELGVDLGGARRLGRLSDLVTVTLPVLVSCFVYGVGHPLPLQLSGEVREAFWVPLTTLCEPERHAITPVSFRGQTAPFPAIRLLPSDRPVLWGLTYRLVVQFFEVVGLDLGVVMDEPDFDGMKDEDPDGPKG